MEVDYRQSVGDRTFYLASDINAEKCKAWKYHGKLIPQSSNSPNREPDSGSMLEEEGMEIEG